MSRPERMHMKRGLLGELLSRLRPTTGAVTVGPERSPHLSARPVTRKGVRRPVIAMKPFIAPTNRFPALLVDSMKPSLPDHAVESFTWNKIGRGAYDVVVFHWPTEFFAPDGRLKTLRKLGLMLSDKIRRGTRFVWVVHNLHPHDSAHDASPLVTGLFLRLLDGLIFLSEDSRRQLNQMYPNTRRIQSLVTAHGIYPDAAVPASPYTKDTFAGRLLFFGTIRAYKNPAGLVRAAREVVAEPFSLRLSGRLWHDDSLKDEIVAAAGGDPRITLDLRTEHIPDDELEHLIDTHDAVVLPYDRILNSGVAFHALCRNKPILAPAIGSLPELRDAVGPQWVHLFEGPLDAAHLESFVRDLPGLNAPAPDMSRFAWDRIGRDVGNFLRSLR